MYNLPRLNHEKIENQNRPKTNEEIESVNENLPKKKSPQPDSFTSGFYQTYKEVLTPNFSNRLNDFVNYILM